MAASIPYPDWLPCALQDGYGFTPVSPLLQTQFTSGRSQWRRGYTSTPTRVAVSWLMRDMEAALFEKWFQEDLLDGSAWFLCWLRTPLGMDYYRSHFVDIYDGGTLTEGKFWKFSATLELFTRPLLPDGSTKYQDAILHSDIIDLAANREWPESGS